MSGVQIQATTFPYTAIVGTFVVGDLLYADSTQSLARRAAVATGSVLVSAGVGAAPAWSSTPQIAGLGVGVAGVSGGVTIGGAANGFIHVYENSNSAFQLVNVDDSRGELNKVTNSGACQIDLNPQPQDGTSSAQFRLWRNTTTTGAASWSAFIGDGTATVNGRLGGNVNSYWCANNSNFTIGSTVAPGTGAVANFCLANTIAVLGAAKADFVHLAAIDNGAGNCEFQVQPEAGGILAWGNNVLRLSGGSNGQFLEFKAATELTTIAAAATTDTAITIPANAVVFAVSVRVTTAIPTAATFTVTGTTSGTQFDVAGGVAVAANTTDVGTRNCPYKNGAAQTIRFTPDMAPATNTGRVRVTIHYYLPTPPTS